MLTKRDRTALYKQIQDLQRLRAKNLRLAMEHAGTWEGLGRLIGQNPTFLKQLASENPQRQIGERLARKIEFDLGVPSGWLDQKH
jgi:hypothetical protein